MKYQIDANVALLNAQNNDARNWGGVSEWSARRRFESNEYFPVLHKAKFEISRNERVFTIGSCFAREVEKVLSTLGVPLALEGHGVPSSELASWKEDSGVDPNRLNRGALNKYAVHAMCHDLTRVIQNKKYDNEGLIEISPGRWFDPHSAGLKINSFEGAMANRRRISDALSQIKSASIVFITLGLTEGWIDLETGMAMNGHPGAAALKKMASRFQFVDYGYDEIKQEIIRMIDVIRSEVNPEMKIVVTVSPVPLGTTFRPTDVAVSSTGSKAVLRAVASDLERTYDFIDYFPSFEMVTLSPREKAWMTDQIHVHPDMVKHVMSTFQNAYIR